MKILFITSNRLGDAVLSTGLLAWMIKHYADDNPKFTIVCGPYAAGLFNNVPQARLIILKKQKWNRHWLGVWKQCRKTKWDLIVDLRNSIVSRLLRSKRRVYGGLHTGKHKVIENADVLHIKQPEAPAIWLSAKAEAEAEKLLPKDRPLLALAPAANWPSKQWAAENFAALAQRLTADDGLLKGAAVMVLADASEREQLQPLLAALPQDRIEIFGKDLQLVAACLKRAALFVGNDSGLMHLSAAVGAPTLGLFGPGYEEVYGPWGDHCATVRTKESREELLARLVTSGNPNLNLMGGLDVGMVVDAAQKLLEKIANPNPSEALAEPPPAP